MTGLPIQLNRLGVGASYIGASELYPPHKERVEENLGKIFKKYISSASERGVPLKLTFDERGAHLLAGSQEVPLPESSSLKEIHRVIQYYQDVGSLPTESLHLERERRQSELEARKSVVAVNRASVPGANGNLLAGMRLADDTLSLTRNILYAIPSLGPKNRVVSHLGYYAGAFWTFFALRELDDGRIEYKRSRLIGDAEGVNRAQTRVLSGSIISVGAFSYLGGKLLESYVSEGAGMGLLDGSNILFGVGSLLSMGATLWGASNCYRFSRRLDEYLHCPNVSEQQRMKGVIQFLKSSITVSSEEREKLKLDIEKEHPDWDEGKRAKFLLQKVADLTEVKVKHLKRRTSNRSIRLIAAKADEILAKLSDPKRVLEGICDAGVLVNTIKKENKVKMGLHLLGFIAALISFVAMMLLTFMPGAGMLPYFLYGISGTIYLTMTIYSIASALFRKEEHLKVADLQPNAPNFSHMAMM